MTTRRDNLVQLTKKVRNQITVLMQKDCTPTNQPRAIAEIDTSESLTQIKELAGRLILRHINLITDVNSSLFKLPDPGIGILKCYSQLVATRYGPMLYISEDDLISRSLKRYGEWAANEINFLSQLVQKGAQVVDIGAFIGTHTRAFSTLVGASGKVHSFEPSKQALKVLRVNAAISEHCNISIYPVAVSSTCSKMEIVTPDFKNLGNTFLRYQSDSSDNTKLQSSTLDSEIDFIDSLDLIKLDVEGMELEALEGAQRLIDKFAPPIYTEANSLTQADSILKWADQFQYEAWGCIHDAFNRENFNNYQDDIFCGGKECGILLISKKSTSHSVPSTPGTMTRHIQSIDDIGLVLAKKPQYSGQPL